MTDIPRVLGQRYEVGDLIGRGGMAQVHMGYDTRLSRTVAIKILRTDLAQDPMFLARFRREAQSAAALNHPSIVSVYDTGEEQLTSENGRTVALPYIIMEYVKGRTVSSLLSDGDPVPIGEAVQITVGVLNALEYSHHEGIIHRDIKPGNVMLTPDGKVKVMDFGIARAIADSAATMTQTNSVVGTAQYLSPEQARGEVVDARSDLYSAGCLLYELLTGKPPFTGDSAVAVAYQHVSETPRPASLVAPDVPDSIDRVVMKALAKQREDRYQSAAEFRTELLSAARGEGVNAPSVTSWNMKPVVPAFPPTAVQGAPTMATAMMPAGTTMHGAGSPTQTGTIPSEDEAKAKKRNRIMVILAIIILLIAGAGIVYAVKMAGNTPAEPTESTSAVEMVTVPDLSTLDEDDVRQALEARNLVFKNGGAKPSETIKEGIYVESDPAIGAQVPAGTTVTVYFSSGPETITVPDLSGMTTEDAIARLEQDGLLLGTTTSVDDGSQEKDRIVSQEPGAGKTANKGTKVNVSIASGNVEIPDLTGKTVAEAQKILTDLGLTLDETINEQETSSYTAGTIISQTRTGLVQKGATIGVTIATAPTSTPSPTSTETTPANPGRGNGNGNN
ncbi:Stk1 family PASTA domain-containing Ser/Thr kinase [Arcanobacterium haemolyticum]|nr:Stk1 family PASTA domain-containing Ser/Thr kinase [Arcanobacterium haemolyticum]